MKRTKYLLLVLFLNFLTQAYADIKINNNQISLSFNDTTFALKKIINLTNGSNINFDEEESPLWAVTFIDTEKDSIKVTDLYTRTSFYFTRKQTHLIEDKINGKLLTLLWTDIEIVPGDTLEVTATVFLPTGENKSIWNIEIKNNSSRYGTFSVDFPYLAIQPLEESRYNDRLVFPSQYGIASGNYSVNIIDTSGVFAFDQFNGSTYTNQLNMPSKSVLLFQIGLSTGVPKMDALKAFDFELNQNYPNPFNAKTIIRFSLSKQQHIRLKIFNLVGQEISELINEQMEAGEHSIHFDASKLESGIYFYRLISENHTSTNKMVLVK